MRQRLQETQKGYLAKTSKSLILDFEEQDLLLQKEKEKNRKKPTKLLCEQSTQKMQ